MPYLLGAAGLFGRLLPRSLCSLRRYRPRESALLRLDSRLDRRVPAGLWRDRGPQSGLSAAFRRKERGMKHLRAVNRKAVKIDEFLAAEYGDVFALQQQNPQPPRPHIPLGCSLVFSPGWEV